jgi:hypothetical protein
MALEIGLWRVDSGAPVRVGALAFPLEARLEELIQSDPTILGEPLLVVGRQVPTASGKFIDLLAVAADGTLHVLELKRDRTSREVVAQVLDYGSWVQGLSYSDVRDIFDGQHAVAFEVAFEEQFGTKPPDELNGEHTLTVSTWCSSGISATGNVSTSPAAGCSTKRLSGPADLYPREAGPASHGTGTIGTSRSASTMGDVTGMMRASTASFPLAAAPGTPRLSAAYLSVHEFSHTSRRRDM